MSIVHLFFIEAIKFSEVYSAEFLIIRSKITGNGLQYPKNKLYYFCQIIEQKIIILIKIHILFF